MGVPRVFFLAPHYLLGLNTSPICFMCVCTTTLFSCASSVAHPAPACEYIIPQFDMNTDAIRFPGVGVGTGRSIVFVVQLLLLIMVVWFGADAGVTVRLRVLRNIILRL